MSNNVAVGGQLATCQLLLFLYFFFSHRAAPQIKKKITNGNYLEWPKITFYRAISTDFGMEGHVGRRGREHLFYIKRFNE